MGADWSAILVVGVRYDTIVEKRTNTHNVTKYDPDTGAAYVKQITETATYLCGQVLQTTAEEALDGTPLEIFNYDSWGKGDSRNAVIGIKVCAIHEVGTKDIPEQSLELVKAETQKALRAIGYEGEIGIFLILDVSV